MCKNITLPQTLFTGGNKKSGLNLASDRIISIMKNSFKTYSVRQQHNYPEKEKPTNEEVGNIEFEILWDYVRAN